MIDGIFFLESDFTGNLEIIGTFEGDEHYEEANRRVTVFVKNGNVSESSSGNVVTLQVKDLDGWKNDLIVNKARRPRFLHKPKALVKIESLMLGESF